MKSGKSLIELAQMVQNQQENKKDYLADTRSISMTDDVNLKLEQNGELEVTDHCHTQIAQRLNIPKRYYDRMREEQPQLLASNVNTWLAKNPDTRMIRTLDGRVRAFLSDRYRPLDNFDLLQPILPKLAQLNLNVASCEITERRMYIKATDPQRVRVSRVKGYYDGGTHDRIDTYTPGVIISNSEVGSGSLWIAPGLHREECTNLAVFKNDGIAKYHVGSKNSADEKSWQYYSDETRRKSDQLLFAKMADLVDACLKGDLFNDLVNRMEKASEDKIEIPAPKMIENVTKKYGMTESEGESVLDVLIRCGDLSRLGVSMAITNACQKVDDYDRSTELERIGGQIIEMTPAEWKGVA